MSTSGVAVSFTLGAALGAGWVKTFSSATKSLSITSSISNILENSLKNLGASKFSITGIDATQKALDDANHRLKKFQSSLKDRTPTENQARDLARLSAAVESATRARNKQSRKLEEWKKRMREANVDVEKSIVLMRAQENLSKLSNSLSTISRKGMELGSVLKNAFLSVSGYIGGLSAATAIVSDWGDTMAKTAQRLGMFDAEGTENVEMLQRMQWAALQANIENEQFVKYLDDMTRRIGQAAAGMGESGKALEQLGLSAKALSGMGADKQFETIVNAFGKIENATERVRLAGMIWGEEAARKMPNLIARGMTQIRADMDNATNYIVTGNKRIVENAGAWDTAMKKLRSVAQSAWRDGMLNFMPLITNAMESLSAKIAENRDRIAKLFEAFKTIGDVAVPAIVSIIERIAEFCSALGENKNLVSDLANTVALAGGAFATWKLTSLCVSIWDTGAAIGSILKTVWAFAKALDWAAFGQKACALATGIWKGVTIAMTAAQWALNAAMSPFGLIVLGIVAAVAAFAGIAYLIYDNWEPISEFFSGLWENLKTGFFAVVDWVKSGFTAAWNWLKSSAIFKAITEIIEWFSDLGGDDVPVPAPASVPISGTELESMTRAAVSNSNSVRTDARTFNTNANISIVQQPGEDSDALAQRR